MGDPSIPARLKSKSIFELSASTGSTAAKNENYSVGLYYKYLDTGYCLFIIIVRIERNKDHTGHLVIKGELFSCFDSSFCK